MSSLVPHLLKLQLGSYDLAYDGWVNTDVAKQILVARVPGLPWLLYKLGRIKPHYYEQHKKGNFRRVKYLDVTKRFPFADSSVDCVFTSHMLEHLFPDEAEFCTREIYRTLKPGGIVRIAVPDLDQIVAEYNPANPRPFLDVIFQHTTRRTPLGARHHWHYNEKSLTALLAESGFKTIYRCAYRQGRCPDVEIIDNRPESLFMEAAR